MLQVFLQLSMFVRQPIRNFNRINITVGLISLVLLALYETFITGSLISPQPPVKFRHIGDLVNAGFIFLIDRLQYSGFLPIETLPDVREAFIKYGILSKLNSTFFDVALVNSSWLNVGETRAGMHFMESPAGNVEMSKIIKMLATNSSDHEFQRGDRLYCDFVTLGDIKHASFQYDTRLMGEMVKIHRRLMACGLTEYWEGMFRSWRFLKTKTGNLGGRKSKVHKVLEGEALRKLLIGMDTLQMIFLTWTILLGLGSLGFVFQEVRLHQIGWHVFLGSYHKVIRERP